MKNYDLKTIKEFYKKIEEYDNIVIYRHQSPDYDALGTQFGIYHFLKHNFKNKNIYTKGEVNVPLGENMYPSNYDCDIETLGKFLAIVCDTSNSTRISDDSFKKADYIVKLDHHENGDEFASLAIVDTDAGAASEVAFDVFTSKPFRKCDFNKESAKFLYSGIAGDTGRFQFSSTSPFTLYAASKLLEYGFDLTRDVYMPMYIGSMEELPRQRKVLDNYKISEHGVAYYYISQKDLDELGMDPDEAKEFLHLFSFKKEVKVWCCFVEDARRGHIRVSLRSSTIKINDIAVKYGGGGHACACGAKCFSMEDVENLVKDLDEYLATL